MKTCEEISPDDISSLRRWIRELDITYSRILKGSLLLTFRELLRLIEDFIDVVIEGKISTKQIFKQYIRIQTQILDFSNKAIEGFNTLDVERIRRGLSKVLLVLLTWHIQQQVLKELM